MSALGLPDDPPQPSAGQARRCVVMAGSADHVASIWARPCWGLFPGTMSSYLSTPLPLLAKSNLPATSASLHL